MEINMIGFKKCAFVIASDPPTGGARGNPAGNRRWIASSSATLRTPRNDFWGGNAFLAALPLPNALSAFQFSDFFTPGVSAIFIGVFFIVSAALAYVLFLNAKYARAAFAGLKQLEAQRRELDAISKTLVRRDFELLQANERLREADELKSQFVTIAAHQLRTPLSGVKWALRLLLDGDLGELSAGPKDFIQRAFDVNERMIRLVNDLLNVSRIEEGRFGYNLAQGDLVLFLQKIFVQSEMRARELRVALAFETPRDAMPPVLFDADKLGIAISNIVDNALNYTPAGGSVRMLVSAGAGYAKILVNDTGVGIPERQMPRLFTKFFRGENVMRMQTDGSGLGLYIAKNVIDSHNGTISISSEEGKGTTVSILLPFAPETDEKQQRAF